MKTYIIKLSVLTPLNIGTGMVKDPLSFMIRKDGNKHEYISFDLEKYIEKAQAQDREGLLKILEKNSYREIINFLKSKDLEAEYSMPASKEAGKIYMDKLESKGKMIPEVIPMMRNPVDFKPFIPGSSIKGVIRTSILNSLINNYDVDRKKSQEIEQELLRYKKVQGDPLKYLSVSDCKIEDENFQRLYAFKVIQEGEFREDLSNLVECLKKDAIGEFTISIDEKIDEKLKEFLDISKITEAINTTHRNILENEIKYYDEKYNKKYFPDNVIKKFNEISSLFDDLKENQAIMRIGRFTQKEYKIFENKSSKYGKTRVLAESILPPGWVQIRIMDK